MLPIPSQYTQVGARAGQNVSRRNSREVGNRTLLLQLSAPEREPSQ